MTDNGKNSLFTQPNKEQQALIEFVQRLVAKGMKRSDIEDAIYEEYHQDDVKEYFCLAYLSSLDVPEEEMPELEEEELEEEAPEGLLPIICSAVPNRGRVPIDGVPDEIQLRADLFIHVEVFPPMELTESEIIVSVSTLRGIKVLNTVFNKNDRQGISGFRVKPIPISEIFDEGYTLKEGEVDALTVFLIYNGSQIQASVKIPFKGCWPPKTVPYDVVQQEMIPNGGTTAQERLTSINQFPGWENLKAHLNELYTRHEVGEMRKAGGFPRLKPTLHNIIIGNTGTGKTSASLFMPSIYKELGYLDTEEWWVVRVSNLVGSHVNSETEALLESINKAKGGTLIFENAHDLFNPDTKNYNSEQRIIRTLIDALSNRHRYPKWMLLLVGEPAGMESLLGAYPELRQYFNEPIYMEDFTPEQLFWMVDAYCNGRKLKLTPEARKKLEAYIVHQYNHRGPGFENGYLVSRLFDNKIVPSLFKRLSLITNPTTEQLTTVGVEDIPAISDGRESSMKELDELIGLGKIKTKVRDYLSAIKLAARRMEMGLPTNMPRLHMAFLGNPGTGKTTVAEIIGKVFASWGILSGGRVIKTEKSQMVGQYIGETEFKMRNLLNRARGNILFIDEAYQLVEGSDQDYGRIVMDSLLTELGKENLDMVVIIAGYTAPMKQLLESNEGIESRFPNVFNFEDYTTDELVEIGKLMIRKQGFKLTPGAEANMRAIIEEASMIPSARFGNGRFVSNLLQNEVFATLGKRTEEMKNPAPEDLSLILPEDVVIGKAFKDAVFDDQAIDAALARLDALVGMGNVKTAIHNFVKSARYLHSIGEPYVGKGLLSWRFVGKNGTGKSTVAEIMAAILKGMRLISNSHITQINAERIFNVPEHECDKVLREAVKKSCNGLIFINADDPNINGGRTSYGRSVEQIRLKIGELTVEVGGECALVLAELEAPNASVVEQLSEVGVYEFDHTLLFKDFTPDELYDILCGCLAKFKISFSADAAKHMKKYLKTIPNKSDVNARTMKLMSRTIYQQVTLREADKPTKAKEHVVLLEDVQMYKWDGHKGKIGF